MMESTLPTLKTGQTCKANLYRNALYECSYRFLRQTTEGLLALSQGFSRECHGGPAGCYILKTSIDFTLS